MRLIGESKPPLPRRKADETRVPVGRRRGVLFLCARRRRDLVGSVTADQIVSALLLLAALLIALPMLIALAGPDEDGR